MNRPLNDLKKYFLILPSSLEIFIDVFFIFSYTIKGALFGATVFGSSELGLWKDGETSRELAKLIIMILTPIANKAKSDMPEQVNYFCI